MKKIILFLVTIFSTIISVHAQWEQPMPGTPIECIYVMDTLIFASSANAGIMILTNHGENWHEVNTGLPFIGSAVAFASKDSIIFVLLQKVFKSTNNGASWVSASNGLPQTQTTITSIAVCGNSIFAGTYNSGIFKSTDNGDSWVAVNNGLTNPYVTTLAVSGSTIYAGTAWWEGGVFVSTDYGDTWSLISHGMPEEDVKSITVKDNNIFIAYRTFGIYFSSDNGTNWAQRNNGLIDTRIFNIKYLGNIIFVSTIIRGVFISYNNGENWIDFNDNLINPGTVYFDMDDVYIYVHNGRLYRRKLIEITELTESDDIKGVNVYPNPTTNILNIEFSNKNSTFVKCKLFNVIGSTILNQNLKDGKTQIDMSNFPAGIYILKVETTNKVYDYKIVKQ